MFGQVDRTAKHALFIVGKGTNIFRNRKSESYARVALEVCRGCPGVVKKLGQSLTFVCTSILTFCNTSGSNL